VSRVPLQQDRFDPKNKLVTLKAHATRVRQRWVANSFDVTSISTAFATSGSTGLVIMVTQCPPIEDGGQPVLTATFYTANGTLLGIAHF
jgi:hypothetical protein